MRKKNEFENFKDKEVVLSDFQVNCENALNATLANFNIPIAFRKLIQGTEENYIEGGFLNCLYWIYEDGAQLNKAEEEFRLEKASYQNLDELLEDFICETKEAISAFKNSQKT